MADSFTITTPIYYVNGEPHIGHTYTTVLADTVARYHRLAGESTFFLTGTDEFGEKIAEAAAARGISPKQIADEISGRFRNVWDDVGFSYDRFIRTSDADHVQNVQRVLQAVYDAGDVDFREYEGLYCLGCERFLTDRDLENGLCRDHERAPERRSEANYFFRMSRYFDWIVTTLNAQPDLVQPERYRNEVLGMLREESGLGDLCISRPRSRTEWGIELPFDSGYVCYVWFDALINYLTGIGYPDGSGWETRWSTCQHLIGKDILKPHAIFWPAMLRSAGIPLFRSLRVHGYWNVDDRKVSKSLGNMIDPSVMKARYGFDSFRYYLLREMSFGGDASFSEEALVGRINADLANNLGNLVSRTLKMVGRFCDARVPEPGPPGDAERELSAAAADTATRVDRQVRDFEFHRALEEIFRFTDRANRYLDSQAPWKAVKQSDGRAAVERCLYATCEALRVTALLLAAFLPESAASLLKRLGLEDALATARLPDDARRWGVIPPGTQVEAGAPLFPRLEAPSETGT